MLIRYITLWPLPLTLELLQLFGCHAFKLCTKCESNGIIHGRVIDDLARFRGAILGVGWGTTDGALSGTRGPNFTKLGEVIGRSSQHCICFKSSDILLHFHTRVIQRWVMLKTTPNVALSPCPLVKIRGGVCEISIPIVEALLLLPTTELPEYIWWPSTAPLLRGVLIKNEPSLAKLKAFPTNTGQPNYIFFFFDTHSLSLPCRQSRDSSQNRPIS